MINLKNKKAAMEMSMGTIVTIVLLMSVLVLGIFMVQNIFTAGDEALEGISGEMNNQINELFAKKDLAVVMAPTDKQITVKRGDKPRGFGFKVKNDVNEVQSFTYTVTAAGESKIKEKCGSSMTIEKANAFLQTDEGSFKLGASRIQQDGEMILLTIPDSAPECTIEYRVDIQGDQGFIETGKMFVTID